MLQHNGGTPGLQGEVLWPSQHNPSCAEMWSVSSAQVPLSQKTNQGCCQPASGPCNLFRIPVCAWDWVEVLLENVSHCGEKILGKMKKIHMTLCLLLLYFFTSTEKKIIYFFLVLLLKKDKWKYFLQFIQKWSQTVSYWNFPRKTKCWVSTAWPLLGDEDSACAEGRLCSQRCGAGNPRACPGRAVPALPLPRSSPLTQTLTPAQMLLPPSVGSSAPFLPHPSFLMGFVFFWP